MNIVSLSNIEKLLSSTAVDIFDLAAQNLFSIEFFDVVELLYSQAKVENKRVEEKENLLNKLRTILVLQKLFSEKQSFSIDEIGILLQYFNVLDGLGERFTQKQVVALALSKIDKNGNPFAWAIVCAQKTRLALDGDVLSKFEWEALEKDLIECSDIFKQSERIIPWLISLVDLGKIYTLRESSDKTQDYETAIELLDKAFFTAAEINYPSVLPVIIHLLGKGYRLRILGDKGQNIEASIAYLEKAISIYWIRKEKRNRALALVDLALSYSQRVLGDPVQNHDKYMSCLRQVIDCGVEVAGEEVWATACHNLGVALSSTLPKKNDLLIEAIGHFDKALDVYTPDHYPLKRGQTLTAKANAYMDLSNVNNLNNVEYAINLFEEAAILLRETQSEKDLAECYNRLGIVYSERQTGIPRENVEKALKYLDSAQELYKKENNTQGIAFTYLNKATTLYHSPLSTSKEMELAVNFLNHSIMLNREAGNKSGELKALLQLATILVQDKSLQRQGKIAEGISLFYQVIANIQPDRDFDDWITAKINLGYALLESHDADYINKIEESINVFKDVLEKADPRYYQFEWARASAGISLAFSERILGDPVENFEFALSHGKRALEYLSSKGNPYEWANANRNLADCYIHSPFGSEQQNFELAIKCLLDAGTVYRKETNPRQYAHLQYCFGLLYARKRSRANLLLAINYYESALQDIDMEYDIELWAKVQQNLGNTFLRLSTYDELKVELAINHITKSLDVYSKESYPFSWALANLNLASAYYESKMSEIAYHNAEQAYNLALQIFTKEKFPSYWQTSLIELQSLHFRYHNFDMALQIGREILDCLDEFLKDGSSDVSKIFQLRDIPRVGEIVSYILAEQGQIEDAIITLDRVRARVISDDILGLNIDFAKLDNNAKSNLFQLLSSIRTREAKLHKDDWYSGYINVPNSDLINFHKENLQTYISKLRGEHPDLEDNSQVDLNDLAQYINNNACLIIPLITSIGSKVFIISGVDHHPSIDVMSINSFTTKSLSRILIGNSDDPGLLEVYRRFIDQPSESLKSEWLTCLEKATGQIWDELFVFLYEEISSRGFTKIYMLPQGALSSFPFNAVWRKVGNRKKYLIEEFEITTIPTLNMFVKLNRKVLQTGIPNKSILAIINPTEDLEFAYKEGEVIKGIFDQRKILTTEANLRKVFFENYQEFSYLHFACHGFYDWMNPWNSGLFIGRDDLLTTDEILSKLNFDKCRLVVLSACETGMVDLENAPGEYIGLSSSFLRVGVPSLITSLWMIDDEATSQIFEKFYELHIIKNLPLSEALRKAQLCVMDMDLSNIKDHIIGKTRMSEEEFAKFANQTREIAYSLKPFSHPYYWASFNLIGI